MSKATKPKAKKSLSTTAVVTIIVAFLGCVGTVTAALIGGVALYMTTQAQITIPVTFTQTAEYRPPQTNNTFDWQNILSIDPQTPCPAVYVPSSLYGGQDKNSWIKDNLFSLYLNDQIMYAPMLINDTSGSLKLYLFITNIEGQGEWIVISKELKINIRRIGTEPDLADIVHLQGCGGEGFYRNFSTVSLNADYPEYAAETVSNDADFYTLEPGESEMFVLNLECGATGVYSIEVEIPIKYYGEDKLVTYESFPGVICPDRLNYDYGSPDEPIGETSFTVIIYNTEQYEWTNPGYRKISP